MHALKAVHVRSSSFQPRHRKPLPPHRRNATRWVFAKRVEIVKMRGIEGYDGIR